MCGITEARHTNCCCIHCCEGEFLKISGLSRVLKLLDCSPRKSRQPYPCYKSTWAHWSQISITVIGIVQLARGKASTSLTESLWSGSSTSPSEYALALYSGLWAFDGWDQANYVGGEMRDATKNIPRAIHASMGIVSVRRAALIDVQVDTHLPFKDAVSPSQRGVLRCA